MRFSKFWADRLHDALLAARGIDEGEHIQKHQHHLRKFLGQCHQREATEEELADVERMLRCRGVMPVSDSVVRAGSSKREKRKWFVVHRNKLPCGQAHNG